ncbi:MAG: hypothetical protein LBT59_05035 [Clostridiales bacterium]|nr:hypothetical protein [Clostridiales bacterium]
MIDARNLPPLKNEGETWEEARIRNGDALSNEMYGILPAERKAEYAVDYSTSAEVAGASCEISQVSISYKDKKAFKMGICMPEKFGGHVILHLAFGERTLEKGKWFEPSEDLPLLDALGAGAAIAVVHANHIEPDNAETFPQGIAALARSQRDGSSMGCLRAWALGLTMAADYFEEPAKIVLTGCSRNGKAALVSGAFNPKIWCTASFSSGCGGAAISRQKIGESIGQMQKTFPHWLCLNMLKYSGREDDMPFDQHMLLSLHAPRKLFVASSVDDAWADPYSEFLSLAYAGEAWKNYGHEGLNTWIWPPVGHLLKSGQLGYYMRRGEHGVKEEDWRALYRFIGIAE